MANLIRRFQNRELSRDRGQEYAFDPFRVMDALLRFEPFRATTDEGVSFSPAFDVKETKDGYLVKVNLPGVRESDIEVSVTGSQVTISGKREHEERQEGDQFFALERSYGSFVRTLTLPDGASVDDIKAELKDGVLSLNIPKRPEVQPRKITIGGGKGTKVNG